MNTVVMTKTSKVQREAHIVHKRWEQLYGNVGLKKLKDAMKRHLYKNELGSDAVDNSHLLMKDYNPLSF